MYARHVALRLRADSVRKFAGIIDSEVIPLLRKQEGFLGHVTLVSPESGVAVVISFWQTKESEESFNRARNPEVLEKLLDMIEGPPVIDSFEAAGAIPQISARSREALSSWP